MLDQATQDLEEIERKIHAALESQLAHTLGQVKALQRVTQDISSTEGEIRQRQAVAAQIEEELKDNTSEGLESELHAEKKRIERLQRIRAALIADLGELANAVSAG